MSYCADAPVLAFGGGLTILMAMNLTTSNPTVVSLSSSNPAVLTVANGGLIAARVGVAELIATAGKDKEIIAKLAVEVTPAALTHLSLVSSSDSDPTHLPLGGTRKFSLFGKYTDDSKLDLSAKAEWTSSDLAVLYVDNDANKGLIGGQKVGKATLTVTLPGQEPKAIEITVGNPEAEK